MRDGDWILLTCVGTIELDLHRWTRGIQERGKDMTFSKWVRFALKTTGIGIVTGLIIGIGIMLINPEVNLSTMGAAGILYNVGVTAIVGALLGVFSHMGFFAYLITNYIANGLFRGKYLWSYIQIFVIIVTAVYSVVLRVPVGESIWRYTIIPLLVILASIPVVYRKVKETNHQSIIPTLFFMIAVTLLEAIPALRQYNPYGTVLMIVPLFVCNAWQILQLHKITEPSVHEKTAAKAS